MVRIVCQVIHRPSRISFLWSEGAASFEPYHLEGDERHSFLKVAGEIQANLAKTEGDGSALAQLGAKFYRATFRLDSSQPGSAAVVHAWFTDLASANRIEQLEFLCDDPARFPWNALIDDGSPGEAWPRFFGSRFSLGMGRRVNPIRTYPSLAAETQRLAADPALIERLNDSQRDRLNSWREAGTLYLSAQALAEELAKNGGDIVVLLARFEHGQLHVGADSFGAQELATWLQAAADANPDPVVILMASGGEQAAWQAFLSNATCVINGLIANEVLLPPGQLVDMGLNLAQQFSRGQKSIGDELRSLRATAGQAGLAFSAFCPPEWRALGDSAPPPEPALTVMPLPERPYHPFAAYDAHDRPLFVGREDETIRCAALIDQAGASGIFLHGSPAVGKTSFLQAGLIPYLEQDNLGFRALRDRSPAETPTAERDYPVLLLRATSDLAGQFADALVVFCAQPLTYPTPTGGEVTVDLPRLLKDAVMGGASKSTAIQASEAEASTKHPEDDVSPRELWIALRDQKDLLARVLDAITSPLPFELVIVVDQGEELLTLVRTAQQRERRQKALDMLSRLASVSPRCKIVYALRSQNLGQLLGLLPDGRMPDDWRSFFLADLSENKLADALLWPTQRDEIPYTSEAPFQKYGFTFEDGMAQQLVVEANEIAAAQQQSPLPIIQAIGALLYATKVRGEKKNIVRMADVSELGGVKQALAKHLEEKLDRLRLANQTRDALRQLIFGLCTSHTDGTLSRDLVPAADLKSHWKGTIVRVEDIANQAAEKEGLLEIQQLLIGGQHEVYVSVPQDSLAQLGKTVEADSLRTLARTRVIDTLWVMVPLVFLAAALAYFFAMNFGSRVDPDDVMEMMEEKAKKSLKQMAELSETRVRELSDSVRTPLYVGLLAEAEQALQAGNGLRARQILLSQPAMRTYGEIKNQKDPTPDIRGFEWRYLWRNLNSERHLFVGHRGVVNCVAISPDSRWAATGSSHDGTKRTGTNEGAIRIWNLANGEIVAIVGDPKIAVQIHALAFSPDGKTLASGGADKQIRLWDVSQLKGDFVEIVKETKTLGGHTDSVFALAFRDASTLASAGADKSVILWDVGQGNKKHTLSEHGAAVHALAFVDAGKTLVSAGAEAQMLIWDVEAGKKRHAIKTAYQTIFALAASDKTVATGGVEAKLDAELGMIRFWDIAASKETAPEIRHASAVFALATSPDGKAIASAGKDHFVRLWDVATGKEQRHWIGHLGWVRALAFSRDGATLLSGSYDSSVKAWHPTQASGPQVVAAHVDWVQALALHHNNALLASGSRDGSVKVWDAAAGKMLLTLPALKGAVTSLAFSSHADKPCLAAGTRDANNEGQITIWQLTSDPKAGWQAKEKHVLKDHRKGITCLAYHPTRSDVLLSGSADSNVILWDAETGKPTETYRDHKDEVRCVAFAADGKTFVSGGKDRQVCAYELGKKDPTIVPDVQLHSVEAIAALRVKAGSQHHPAVLTGSADHCVRLTYLNKEPGDSTEKREIWNFRAHHQPVSALVYAELKDGGNMIVSSSWDGTIKLYDKMHERFTFLAHTGAVRALALASDQSFLASAGNDGTIRIWRAHQERVVTRKK